MARCVIVTGGDRGPVGPLNPDDCIIACDRGYTYARRCGIRPDLLVSDFDSYDGPVDPEIPLQRFPSEKDDTDTMIAIRAALERGFREAVLYCALGGRLDHTLANLQSLAFALSHGLRLRIVSEDTEVLLLQDGTLSLPRREGFALSVFAFSERCRGVSLHGTKYTLTDAELENSFPLGVSNEWAEDAATVSITGGTLLIVLSKL